MCTPFRLIVIAGTVLLGAVETGSAATTRAHHPARVPSAAPVQGNWCLYYHAGGANCRFGDFQGCMYAAAAAGGCMLVQADALRVFAHVYQSVLCHRRTNFRGWFHQSDFQAPSPHAPTPPERL